MARPRTPKGRARETAVRLADEYPGTARDLCALVHDGPYQLLVATMTMPCLNQLSSTPVATVFDR